MAASTGIALSATAISFANEWYQTNQLPWRVAVGGLLLAAFLGGAEKIPDVKPVAVGLASIMLVTVLVTPIAGEKSPLGTLSGIVNKPAARKA